MARVWKRWAKSKPCLPLTQRERPIIVRTQRASHSTTFNSTCHFYPLSGTIWWNQTSKGRAYMPFRTHPSSPNLLWPPNNERLCHEIEAHQLAHSQITSYEQMLFWVEVTPKILPTPAFMVVVDKILDNRKWRAAVRAARAADTLWVKEAPQHPNISRHHPLCHNHAHSRWASPH